MPAACVLPVMPNPTKEPRPATVPCQHPDCPEIITVGARGALPKLCPKHKHEKLLADARAKTAIDAAARGLLPPEPRQVRRLKNETVDARLTGLEYASTAQKAHGQQVTAELVKLRRQIATLAATIENHSENIQRTAEFVNQLHERVLVLEGTPS